MGARLCVRCGKPITDGSCCPIHATVHAHWCSACGFETDCEHDCRTEDLYPCPHCHGRTELVRYRSGRHLFCRRGTA